jgi:hypothetical protein
VAADEQLARVLGPEWQALRYSQLFDQACRLEQTVSFTRLLGRYTRRGSRRRRGGVHQGRHESLGLASDRITQKFVLIAGPGTLALFGRQK